MPYCHLCARAAGANQYRVFTRKHAAPAKGLVVCAQCERTKPRCAACQTPMREDRRALGVCGDCVREGLRCRACGKKIRGDFIILSGNDGPYCRACCETRASCVLCGAPVGSPPKHLPDDRVLCDRCDRTRVTTPAEAQALFERVIDLLYADMGMALNIRPTLMLVDHARLVELARTAIPDSAQRREKTVGMFTRAGRRRVIYLQEQLPRILLIQVVAHEFAHAWQGENAPFLTEPVLHEGFAEWTAHHVLLQLDARKKAEQQLARQDFYGDGLRQLLALEQQGGVSAVLDYVRTVR